MSKVEEQKRKAAAKRIINEMEKFNLANDRSFPVGYSLDGNYQMIANAYCGVYLFEGHHIDGIPQCPDNKPTNECFSKIIDNLCDTNLMEITSDVPSIEEIKAYTSRVRKENRYYERKKICGAPMFIRDDLVNTRYLMDVMTILPNASVFVNPDYTCRPVLFRSDYGMGVVLPILPLGAVDGWDEFCKNHPGVNNPHHFINVIFNKYHERTLK